MEKDYVKVLLVDDDEDDYILTRSWLSEIEGQQFTLDWVASYEMAVETIGQGQHDVYLVDYRLGEHSGLELLRTVITGGCKAPVIMLTGQGDHEVDEEALYAGAADYLLKTQINADLLGRSIRYAREHKRVEAALHEAHAQLETRVQERTAELRQALAALQDEMAERERAEQKLRESERLATIGTTAAKLAHEIANPLNGMAMTIQMLERHLAKPHDPTDGEQIEIVQDLKHETHRLQALLQELRALAHPPQLNFQPTDVATLVAEVLRLQGSHYTEQGISVEQSFPVALPLILADQEKLSQALLNLCKNAAEAMPTGGTLAICGTSAAEQVCLEIRDTGEGVLEGANIFEPFATTKSEGTGLGLAIVQQIVAAHHGTITYTSKPGQGTTFTLQLPVAPPRQPVG